MKRSFRSTASTVALAGVGVVLVLAFFHNALFAAMGGYLVNAVPPQKGDVALVLAGDSFGNRILTAAELVKQGYVPRALISGPAGNYGTYECDLAIPFAVRKGYPAEYFLHMEHHARSTMEEAAVTLNSIRKSGGHRVLLVTSNYHTRRAGKIFRRAAPDLEFVVIAAPDDEFTPDGWWHTRQGRKVAAFEWMKTVAEWFGI